MGGARTLLSGLAGIAIWSILVAWGGESAGDVGIDDPATETATALPDAAPSATAAPTIENRNVRTVHPELFAAPFAEMSVGLERIEARPPLTPPKEKPEPEKVVLLPRPLSIEAGFIGFGARSLKLADIVPTDRMRTCRSSSGEDWPCGMLARTQQRQLLRGRAITCETDLTTWEGTITARCKIGGIDISEWLAAAGWAEAPEGSPLAELTAKARAEGKGLFGDNRH